MGTKQPQRGPLLLLLDEAEGGNSAEGQRCRSEVSNASLPAGPGAVHVPSWVGSSSSSSCWASTRLLLKNGCCSAHTCTLPKLPGSATQTWAHMSSSHESHSRDYIIVRLVKMFSTRENAYRRNGSQVPNTKPARFRALWAICNTGFQGFSQRLSPTSSLAMAKWAFSWPLEGWGGGCYKWSNQTGNGRIRHLVPHSSHASPHYSTKKKPDRPASVVLRLEFWRRLGDLGRGGWGFNLDFI